MGFSTIIMFVVFIGLIFYMQRQQKKQAQERQNQMNALQKGDEVITIGGMYALVDEVDQAANKIILDVDGVYLPFELGAIKRIVTKASAEAVTTSKELVEDEKTEEVTPVPAAEEVRPATEESAIQTAETSDSAIQE